MASLPRCYGCEKCNVFERTCDVYKDGIPSSVIVAQDCEEFEPEKPDEPSEGYPMAKGR